MKEGKKKIEIRTEKNLDVWVNGSLNIGKFNVNSKTLRGSNSFASFLVWDQLL